MYILYFQEIICTAIIHYVYLLFTVFYQSSHYQELDEPLRKILGDHPNDYTEYWLDKFPCLLNHTWQVNLKNSAFSISSVKNLIKFLMIESIVQYKLKNRMERKP